MNAGCVHEDHLAVLITEDPQLDPLGRLRTGRNSRDLLSQQQVDQCRLPDVRTSDHTDISGIEFLLFVFHYFVFSW